MRRLGHQPQRLLQAQGVRAVEARARGPNKQPAWKVATRWQRWWQQLRARSPASSSARVQEEGIWGPRAPSRRNGPRAVMVRLWTHQAQGRGHQMRISRLVGLIGLCLFLKFFFMLCGRGHVHILAQQHNPSCAT